MILTPSRTQVVKRLRRELAGDTSSDLEASVCCGYLAGMIAVSRLFIAQLIEQQVAIITPQGVLTHNKRLQTTISTLHDHCAGTQAASPLWTGARENERFRQMLARIVESELWPHRWSCLTPKERIFSVLRANELEDAWHRLQGPSLRRIQATKGERLPGVINFEIYWIRNCGRVPGWYKGNEQGASV